MKKMKLISSVTCTLMGMGTISIATATTIKSASSANSWNANTVYNSGDQVSYNGKTYTAKWWTKVIFQEIVMYGVALKKKVPNGTLHKHTAEVTL